MVFKTAPQRLLNDISAEASKLSKWLYQFPPKWILWAAPHRFSVTRLRPHFSILRALRWFRW